MVHCTRLHDETGTKPDLREVAAQFPRNLFGERSDMPYIYRWDRHGRKGQPCKVTARSRRGKGFHNFNSIRVEFADGYEMITSGNAIRRVPSANVHGG